MKNVVRRSPVPGGGCATKNGHSLAPVKIWGGSIFYGPKYGLLKNLILVGNH